MTQVLEKFWVDEVQVTTKREISISKEDAVFWMDGNGCWWNAHGKFRHKKIIDHFHASIEKDEGGYFVRQERGDIVEKVYFPYEDTALFVFDVIVGDDVRLMLNIGRKVTLVPEQLYVEEDILFMRYEGEVIKFTDRSMLKIMGFIDENGGQLYFSRDGRRDLIRQK